MAKFFVGQRVRIIGAAVSKFLIGTESHVIGFKNGAWDGENYYDGWVTSSEAASGLPFVAKDDQLEPILPEGAQPLGYSFEQMMSEFGVTEAVK